MYVPTTIYFVTILLDVTEKLKSVNKSLHTSRRSIFCAQTSSTRKSPSRESSSSWTLPQLLCFLCRCLILLRHGSYRRKWSHRQLRQELPVPRGRGSPSPTFVSRAELATGGLEPYCFLVFSRAPWFPPPTFLTTVVHSLRVVAWSTFVVVTYATLSPLFFFFPYLTHRYFSRSCSFFRQFRHQVHLPP